MVKLPPAPAGYERIVVAGKVLLVEVATQIVHDVLGLVKVDQLEREAHASGLPSVQDAESASHWHVLLIGVYAAVLLMVLRASAIAGQRSLRTLNSLKYKDLVQR